MGAQFLGVAVLYETDGVENKFSRVEKPRWSVRPSFFALVTPA